MYLFGKGGFGSGELGEDGIKQQETNRERVTHTHTHTPSTLVRLPVHSARHMQRRERQVIGVGCPTAHTGRRHPAMLPPCTAPYPVHAGLSSSAYKLCQGRKSS